MTYNTWPDYEHQCRQGYLRTTHLYFADCRFVCAKAGMPEMVEECMVNAFIYTKEHRMTLLKNIVIASD